jgi:hypothetical protein
MVVKADYFNGVVVAAYGVIAIVVEADEVNDVVVMNMYK